MEPIDEVDAKKKRRAMLENMQRSSPMFQSQASKVQKKSVEQAKVQQQQQAQVKTDDTLDFSSELANQESNLESGKGSNALSSWDDLIEDDDWLNQDASEDDDSEEHGAEHSLAEEEEPEPEPEPEPASGRPSNLNAPPTSLPPRKNAPPKTEERLGFEWGEVEKKPEPKPPAESGRPTLSKPSGSPSVGRSAAPVPMSATRSGGWESRPNAGPVISPRVRPLGSIMLPPRGQVKEVDSAVVSAARLLIVTPDDEPGYEECIRLLSRFGLGAIRLCQKAKVKVHILDEKGFKTHPELQGLGLDGEDYPVDGAYLVESRSCLIDRRCLTEKPKFFHPALYYFAHALDHAQGGDDFSSRKAAAVLACFDASCNGFNGCDFVDELAAADPVRYFARSISIYLGRDDCTEPIWTHQDLFDFDKSMYDYLQYLFARFS